MQFLAYDLLVCNPVLDDKIILCPKKFNIYFALTQAD